MFSSRFLKNLSILSLFAPMVSAWTAKWIDLGLDVGNSINPPRSGHAAFGLDDKIYVFGGYAEDRDTAERYPTNDLWSFKPGDEQKWTLEKPASSSEPQPRLASTAITCQLGTETTAGLVLGGWDSQEAGTGGVILKDIQAFTSEDGGMWKELPVDLEEPTSRLCALPLVDKPSSSSSSSSKVLVHNHRCTDHVLLLDLEASKLTKQPVSGTAPSARGLHCCVQLPGTSKVVLFGGAAQSGTMSNEVFVLDTETWVWEDCDCGGDAAPSPRASPCFVALDDKTCILFGGASPSDEVGLHGCSDTWLLELEESKKDGSTKTTAKWTQLGEDRSSEAPPGRNAATLTPLPSSFQVEENENEGSQHFLLSGGWYPFRTTYGDNFVLKVTKN